MATQITVIDTQLHDYQVLEEAALEAGLEVILLSGSGDGVSELAAALKGRSGIDALHILSHGSNGQISLGGTSLNGDTLESYSDEMAVIREALSEEGDLLLYSCNVASDEQGQAFVNRLAEMTQSDVAASDDLTGAGALGGDWDFETVIGSIESPTQLFSAYQGVLAVTTGTYTFGTSPTGVVGADNSLKDDTYEIQFTTDGTTASGLEAGMDINPADPSVSGVGILAVHGASLSDGNATAGVGSTHLGLVMVTNANAGELTNPVFYIQSNDGTGTSTIAGTGGDTTVPNAGAEFDLDGFTLTFRDVINGTTAFTITGYRDNVQTGQVILNLSDGVSSTVDPDGTPITNEPIITDSDLGSGFDNIDRFTITAPTLRGGITIDDLIISNAVTGPSITSATYDASTGWLVVTGTGFTSTIGAANDVIANKFTIAGEGGATYTLTDTANVDIASGSAFTLALSATDKAAINQMLNKDGVSSTSGTTYDVSGAAGFIAASAGVSDTGANAITVTNVAVPTITSASYDYSTNVLTVTGTDFLAKAGASNDIDVTKLTLTGEGGSTYTLTSPTNVDVTNGTSFTVTLSGSDVVAVEALLNKDGTSSSDSTTYNLAAAEDWAAGANSTVVVADTTGNGITVSNYAVPALTSATYNWSTGQLVLTGTNFVSNSGASNDIDASRLTLTGEGGSTYTLTDTADVEISSDTAATITLSATDKLHIQGLMDKDGTASSGATTYNLAAADDWMNGAPTANDIADLTGNGITVGNVTSPTITSATYDSGTGVLAVSGTNLFHKVGAANDIDVSTLTLTGGLGDATYTIASTADVEITSATSFSVTLTGSDKTNVDALLDQSGTTSSEGSTYNLAAADNWLAAADGSADISDNTNAISVSIAPSITSATFDATSGALVVTGSNIQANGGGADIDASQFTLTGEGGTTYTLTDTSDVERTSLSEFTLTLSANDLAAVKQLLNKDGTGSTGGTTYNLAAADDWDTNVTAGDTSDATGNGITVSNVPAPTISSATYNASTGTLVLTGTNFVSNSGANNDIDASTLTLTGEGGSTYTLIDTANVEITSATSATLTLSATDMAAANLILNKNGTSSTGATTYNVAVGEDWMAGADAAVTIADLAGNAMTVSGVARPTITSATYNTGTGVLAVTGTGLLKANGASNDIDASLLTITGEGGATYTLTDTADVEITSGTSFSLTLSSTDKASVNALLDKDGTSSNDATTYNLAAAEDWAVGADAAVDVIDQAGNGINVTVYVAPTSTGGSGGSNTSSTATVDGVPVTTTTSSDGTQTITFTVPETRTEDGATATPDADIPLVQNSGNNDNVVTVSLPASVSITATGPATAQSGEALLTTLVNAIDARNDTSEASLIDGARSFLSTLAEATALDVRTIVPTTTSGSLTDPIVITGTSSGQQSEALVIDLRSLPASGGTQLRLDNIEFASIMGSATVTGGSGANYVTGDDSSQFFVLGADDDILHGGGGDDTVGSKGGDDLIFGDAGNDTLFGGTGHNQIHGGTDSDVVTYDGNIADYVIVRDHGKTIVTSQSDPDMQDTLINAELIRFSDQDYKIENSNELSLIATLYMQVLDRQAEIDGFQFWANVNAEGVSLGAIAMGFLRSVEKAQTEGRDFDLFSAEDQIESLYTHFLGRAAEDEGKAYWIAQLNDGTSIEEIANDFVYSAELAGMQLTESGWDFMV